MNHHLLSTAHRSKLSTALILPYLKKKRIMCSCIILTFALMIAAFLTIVNTDRNSFIPYLRNVEVLSYQNDLHVAVDETILDYNINAEKLQKFSTSIDGKVAAFLTNNKELYLVQNQKIKKIADDVLHFELSSSGQGIAFAQKYAKQNALSLYNLKEGTRREVTTLLSRFDFSLSPDGQTLSYYTQVDNQEILMCHRKGKELTICSTTSDLVGLSDDGQYIYAVCPDSNNISVLFVFDYKGRSTELGTVSSISFKFNEDHRQIMFYDNGKTLISVNGKPAMTAASYPLYLVTVPGSRSASDGNSITLPITTMFDHIYTSSDGESTSAWLIRRNPNKSEKLVSRVSSCTLDTSAEYLYYIYNSSQLCVMNISNGLSRSHTLAENVDYYTVSSDRSKVYYTDNGSLYCASGRKSGKSRLLTTNTSGYIFVMSESDVLYYLADTNLYACRNGRKSNLLAENIQSVYSSANNVVYIIGENAVYAAYSKNCLYKF